MIRKKEMDYFRILFEQNSKMNLVSRKLNQEDFITRSLIEAEILCGIIKKTLTGTRSKEIVDIGSGAGLPVVLLAACLHSASFTAIEANTKKAAFIQKTAQKLSLKNISVINKRVEAINLENSKFDIGTAKAVASTAVLLEYFAPIIKINGFVLLPKGSTYQEEVIQAQQSARITGFELAHVLEGAPANKESAGKILLYKKARRATVKLPRPIGVAGKQPFL